MKSTAPNSERDEIEVLDGKNVFNGIRYARVRVREGVIGTKASIFLSADELEAHAAECVALATKLRAEPGNPGLRSVYDVTNDPAYQGVRDFEPNEGQIVVRHRDTDTYWACLVFASTIEFKVPVEWKPVRRVVTQITRFV